MGKRAQQRRQKQQEEIQRRKEVLAEIRRAKNPLAGFWRRADFWVYVVSLIMLILFPFLSPKLQKFGIGNPVKSSVAPVMDTAVIHTSMGDIEIALYKKDAPKAVENFEGLAKKNYYDNLTWHRVIKDFVIQGGDPTGSGNGGTSVWGGKFDDEINPLSLGLTQALIDTNVKAGYKYNYNLNSHKIVTGSVAYANSGPNTNGSQFFIVTAQDQPSLDGKYTDFGMVTKGMEVVSAIAAVPTDSNDKPTEPVYMMSVEIK